eukprot:Colp12_sorted_trinity150504_noHs@22321
MEVWLQYNDEVAPALVNENTRIHELKEHAKKLYGLHCPTPAIRISASGTTLDPRVFVKTLDVAATVYMPWKVEEPTTSRIVGLATPAPVDDASALLWGTIAVPFEAVPPLSDLEVFVFARPPCDLPVASVQFAPLKTQLSGLGFYDVANTPEHLFKYIQIASFLGMVAEHEKEGTSEDDTHFTVDLLLREVMKYMKKATGKPMTFQRNTADHTSTTKFRKRPDYLTFFASALVNKGEDKRHVSQLLQALDELTSKMNTWDFCNPMPYLLCYACAGLSLQFAAVYPHNSGFKCQPIGSVLALDTVIGRMKAVLGAINIFRLILTFEKEKVLPQIRLQLFVPQVRDNGNIVEVRTDCCLKTVKNAPVALYEEINKSQSVPNSLVHGLVTPRRGGYDIVLTPVGVEHKPASRDDWLKFLGDICRALNWLHERGWVHRDIRWGNIIYASGRWVLIDLESAAPVRSPIDFSNEYQAPEVSLGSAYEASADMYQLGKLMFECEELQDIRGQLVSLNPDSRPSALDVLRLLKAAV